MEHINSIISSELRFPSETSKKKKRYVTFKCIVCGVITEQVFVKSHYNGKCKYCVQHTMTTDEFIAIGKQHFGQMYDYTKVHFLGTKKKVTIICPIHGDFNQRAKEHIDGHGCRKCAQEKRKIDFILPKETWIERLKNYPLISFSDEAQIKNYHGDVDLICQVHGKFTAKLGSIGSSQYLCKECAFLCHQQQSIRPELCGLPATIYYVYLPNIGMYKLGVTCDLSKRLKSLGECILIASGTKEYTEALRLEHQAHQALKMYQYKGRKKLVKNGSTELYVIDVLPQLKRALQQ